MSKSYDLILVLKDEYTIVLYNGKGYVNSTGNPGMATAGSGDVLTGMITGLIAQDYDALTASKMAVYLHGRAADIAVQKSGFEGLTAGLITKNIGSAFLDLFRVQEEESSDPK